MKLHYHTTITIQKPGLVTWFVTEGDEFISKGSATTLEKARSDSHDDVNTRARLAEQMGHWPIKSTESVYNNANGSMIRVGSK